MWLIVFVQLLNPFNGRKTISRGYWGCKILFSESVMELTLSCENGKSEGVEGLQMKFPPWWGSGYFLETHIC